MTTKAKKSSKELREKFGKAASGNSGRIHVVPSKDGWSVKKEGATRASAVAPTKDSAIRKANSLSSAKQVIVHKKDGTIQTNKKIK